MSERYTAVRLCYRQRSLNGSDRRCAEINGNQDAAQGHQRFSSPAVKGCRHNQHGLGRTPGDRLGDRAKAEAIETCSPVCAEHNQVRPSGARMQEDDPGRIAVLNADLEAHAGGFRRLAQFGEQGDALACLPFESPVPWHRVHDSEFCLMHTAQGERVIERTPRGFRKVDGSQNTTNLIHVVAPNWIAGGNTHVPQSLGQGRSRVRTWGADPESHDCQQLVV
jgi:hypothetical protein